MKKSSQIRGTFLRLTEETNALDYLRRAVDFVLITERDRLAWKWVVLGLHGALYGFAISALQGTNPDRVVRTSKKGHEWLIDFDTALERCQDQAHMNMTINSRVLVVTEAQRHAIRLLKGTLRNNLQHYKPMGWSIELHGMPQMSLAILDIIRFLALDTGNFVSLKESRRREVRSLVFRARRFLLDCRLDREARQSTGAKGNGKSNRRSRRQGVAGSQRAGVRPRLRPRNDRGRTVHVSMR